MENKTKITMQTGDIKVTISTYAFNLENLLDAIEVCIRGLGFKPKGILTFSEGDKDNE